MSHFQRGHPRHHPQTGRERSSNWRYPRIKKGASERGRASTRRNLPSEHMDTWHGEIEIRAGRIVFHEWPRDGWGDTAYEGDVLDGA